MSTGKSVNPAYPDAHPTAPGGMSKANLRLELAEVHKISMDETRETGWPALIDMVIEQRRLREREAKVAADMARPGTDEALAAVALGETASETECSYCEEVAVYVGAGQDGDFYCDEHVDEAPGEVVSLVEIEDEEADDDTDMFDALEPEPEPEGDTDEIDDMFALLDEDEGATASTEPEVLDDEDVEPERDDAREQALRGMDMPALKSVAREHGMSGYSALRRAALIEAILDFEQTMTEYEDAVEEIEPDVDDERDHAETEPGAEAATYDAEDESDIIDPESFFAEMISERDEHEATLPAPLFLGIPGVKDYVFDGHAGAGPSGAERWMNCTASLEASRKFLETLSPNQQRAFAGANTAARQGTTAHAAAEVEANHVLGRVDAEEVNTTLLELMTEPPEGEAYTDEMGEYITEYVGLVQSLAAERGEENVRIEARVNAAIPLTDLHEGEVYIIRGSADCAAVPTDEHPELVVADLKYGDGIFVDVEANPQVRIYALGVLEELVDEEGMLTVDIDKITYYIAQPRLGGLRSWTESLDDLLDWRDEVLSPALTAALGGIDEGGATFNPGDVQCQFCPARGRCPALAELRMEAAAEAFDLVQEAEYENGIGSLPDPTSLDNDRLGTLLKQIKDLVNLYSDLKDEGQRRLHRGERVPGFKLVNYSPPRTWTEGAEEKIKKIRLTAEQRAALYTEPKIISPTQAEKVLGEVYGKVEALVVKPEKRPVIGAENDRRSEWTGKPPEQMFADESGAE